jgi:hypothetical protein
MTTYNVYKVEDKMSVKGNAYKKLVLQEPKSQYPLKNVTMFASHPLFEDIAPGQTVELEIETKDSDTPNPHGGFYKNRTVLNPGVSPKKADNGPAASNGATAELKNILQLKVIPMLEAIHKENIIISERLDKALGVEGDTFQEPDFGPVSKEDSPF